MAKLFLPAPPPAAQKVDDDKGVSVPWAEWFVRLYGFLNDLYKLVLSIQITANTTQIGGEVPYYIPLGDTFEVPLYKQALFRHAIENRGVIVIEGLLIQVP